MGAQLAVLFLAVLEPLHKTFLMYKLDASCADARMVQGPFMRSFRPANSTYVLLLVVIHFRCKSETTRTANFAQFVQAEIAIGDCVIIMEIAKRFTS